MDYIERLKDFIEWASHEQKKYKPTGLCIQDYKTTSGYAEFMRVYPTFQEAYAEYMKMLEKIGTIEWCEGEIEEN